MKMPGNVLHLFCLIATIVIFPSDVHAYIDPGAGSMLLQAVIAAIAGGLVVIKVYWQRIKRLFTRHKARSAKE